MLAHVPHRHLGVAKRLVDAGQGHIFEAWGPGCDDNANEFFQQVEALDAAYPGGLTAYITKGKRLLRAAVDGVNPFHGCTASVPDGVRLELGTSAFDAAEARGVACVPHTAFVLVAGGLGERLGFPGLKVAIPAETTTGTCYLQLYTATILALQRRAGGGVRCPLVIMTSDDTHAATAELLARHHNFGMAADQITLLKQEKVAAFSDASGRLAMDSAFRINTKPHGHGDVHTLLHRHGVVDHWLAAGLKYVMFLQDTNALAFFVGVAALGVSARDGLEINAVCLPRRAGEAVGVIAVLHGIDGTHRTTNVEYSQLDALLRDTNGLGDVNDDTGFSPYPGNTNTLIYALPQYAAVLARTGGLVPEFVNPKFAKGGTGFKAPTRLECMMQDHSRMTLPGARVAYTMFGDWIYMPCKNSVAMALDRWARRLPLHCASASEMSLHQAYGRVLSAAGVAMPPDGSLAVTGLRVPLPPRVVLHPSFACTVADVRARFPTPHDVHITPRSTLVVHGAHVTIHHLDLDGALEVHAVDGAVVDIRRLCVRNRGSEVVVFGTGDGDKDAPHAVAPELAIRGFRIQRHAVLCLRFTEPGRYVVDDVSARVKHA